MLDGSDITIIAYSRAVETALKVPNTLKDKMPAEVINLRSLKPLDKNTIIKSVKKQIK